MGHNIKSPAGRSRKGGTKGTTSPKNDDPTGQNPPRTRSRKNQRHRPWIFLSVIVISLGKCSYLVSAETMTEKEILGSLYDFTNGDSWKVNENWKSDSVGICDWHGITCDPTTNKVTQIGLDRNNLSGSIPPSLWKLASLTQVSVRNNLLTSLSLTEFLTRDPENDPRSPLDTLIAAENHLTNVDGIGNIAATLKHLNINKNHIETSVLDEISSCVNLVTLYIAFNQISGRLSTTIGRLTDLTEIYAFDNRLTGQIPTELGLLDLVQVLGLGNNLFTGTLPTELEQMVNMEDLSIHHVRNEAQGPDTGPSNWGLSGPLLTFGDMPHLSLLFLDGNMFTGTIPSDFLRHNTFTDSPVSVGLTNNKLTGTIPKSLERFESLSIDLVGNLITGIPEELCRKGGWMGGLVEEFKCDAILCSSGTYNPLGRAFGSENPCMRCSSNNFTNLGATTCQVDEGSDDASKPQNGPLKTWEILAKFYLVMAGEKWAIQDGWDTFHGLVGGGTTIAELEKADIDVCNGWYGVICNSDQQVTDISLVNNGLYGVVPDSIFSIPTLQAFDVSNNNVQMITLKGASQAQNLTSLILSNVKIQSIEGIGGMKNLRQLLLDGLNIEAPLTSELFELTNLRTLHLQHGHFTGVIPTQIGQLTELEDLNIYGNDLNGTLPSEIGALIRLRSLDLSENRFAGSIPTEISALAELEVFAIHQLDAVANIGGQIPAFDTFPRLKEVNLEYNELTGTIPTNFLARVADKSSEITLSLGFNRLEGAIPESLNSFAKLILNLEGNRITRCVKV
jgi:Leucine-rich repeat (LRR) protein